LFPKLFKSLQLQDTPAASIITAALLAAGKKDRKLCFRNKVSETFLVYPRLYGRRHRQNLVAVAKITPLVPQFEDNIRFHAVCSAVTVSVRYSNGQR